MTPPATTAADLDGVEQLRAAENPSDLERRQLISLYLPFYGAALFGQSQQGLRVDVRA